MPPADNLKIAIGAIVTGCFALALGKTTRGRMYRKFPVDIMKLPRTVIAGLEFACRLG